MRVVPLKIKRNLLNKVPTKKNTLGTVSQPSSRFYQRFSGMDFLKRINSRLLFLQESNRKPTHLQYKNVKGCKTSKKAKKTKKGKEEQAEKSKESQASKSKARQARPSKSKHKHARNQTNSKRKHRQVSKQQPAEGLKHQADLERGIHCVKHASTGIHSCFFCKKATENQCN